MKLEVSDSMFMISTLDGSDIVGGPDASPIAQRLDPASNFVTIFARDQFRPVKVELAESSVPPSTPTFYDSLCEFSVRVGSGLMVEDFEAERQLTLTKRAGDLRVRITVRRSPPENNPERPSETFLIECWPAPPAPQVDDHPRLTVDPVHTVDPVRTTRPDDVIRSDELMERGAAAATRIGNLLTDPVPDQEGRCTASILIPRRRRITFNRTATVCNWMGNGCSGYFNEVQAGTVAYSQFSSDWVGYLNGQTNNGTCRRTSLEAHPTRSVVHAWEWLIPPGGRTSAPHDEQVPLLPQPTVVTLTYTAELSDDDTPWTRIELTHEHLPSTWAPLMADVWKAGLARLPGWALTW